jgi:hypothetical protein
MLKPTKSDGLSRGSHYTQLKVPAAKHYWPRPALAPGIAVDVVGIAHRREAALRFAKGALKCEKANRLYGARSVAQSLSS